MSGYLHYTLPIFSESRLNLLTGTPRGMEKTHSPCKNSRASPKRRKARVKSGCRTCKYDAVFLIDLMEVDGLT